MCTGVHRYTRLTCLCGSGYTDTVCHSSVRTSSPHKLYKSKQSSKFSWKFIFDNVELLKHKGIFLNDTVDDAYHVEDEERQNNEKLVWL